MKRLFFFKRFLLNLLSGLLVASGLLCLYAADDGQASEATRQPAAKDAPIPLTEEERSWLREHPLITMANDPAWPPVEFTDEQGEHAGMSADYLRLIEQRLGLKFKRVPDLTWMELYGRHQRRELDLATCVAETPPRLEIWAFTKPYLRVPVVIATLSDVTYISDMKELIGKKVALPEGYAVDHWITADWPGINLVRVSNAQVGLTMLQQGEVFAFVDSLLIIGDHQAKLKVTNVKIAGQTPYAYPLAMAVRKDWAPLVGILNKAIDSISESERAEIYRRWLPVRYEHGFDYGLLWKALAVFAAILLALVVWNLRLAREIRNRQRAEEALKKSGEALKSSLAEKESLLKEVHHRVKNNLQIISSLLHLQGRKATNPEALSLLVDAQNRVRAMALLHETLYQSGNLSKVNFPRYVKSICSHLMRSCGRSVEGIRLHQHVADVTLGIDQAIPAGLIISEVVTNALKHAFPSGSEGDIVVELRVVDDQRLVLRIADNGVGFPAEKYSLNSQTLGLTLVTSLSRQLNGELSITSEEGTVFAIDFPAQAILGGESNE